MTSDAWIGLATLIGCCVASFIGGMQLGRWRESIWWLGLMQRYTPHSDEVDEARDRLRTIGLRVPGEEPAK